MEQLRAASVCDRTSGERTFGTNNLHGGLRCYLALCASELLLFVTCSRLCSSGRPYVRSHRSNAPATASCTITSVAYKTLRITPVMEAGVGKSVRSLEQFTTLADSKRDTTKNRHRATPFLGCHQIFSAAAEDQTISVDERSQAIGPAVFHPCAQQEEPAL